MSVTPASTAPPIDAVTVPPVVLAAIHLRASFGSAVSGEMMAMPTVAPSRVTPVEPSPTSAYRPVPPISMMLAATAPGTGSSVCAFRSFTESCDIFTAIVPPAVTNGMATSNVPCTFSSRPSAPSKSSSTGSAPVAIASGAPL